MTNCLGKSCSFGFKECLLVCTCASFPFGLEGGNWDVFVLVPDHCLSFYLSCHALATALLRSVKQ